HCASGSSDQLGTGDYSNPLTIQTPDDVFLRLNGAVIPNNGLLNISDIGSSDDTALLCITNRPPPSGNPPNSGGNWLAPDGTRVGDKDNNDVQGFVRNRGPMVVRLKRTAGTAAEGIYRCSVNDTDSTPHSLYVGLYTSGRGQVMLSTLPPHSITSGASPQFTLTCISTGGPATTVTWTRDNVDFTGEVQKTVLNDPETANYSHTLNVTTAGDYICTVSNIAFSASATIPLEGTSPPTGVTAVQDGPTSITVTWTPPSPLDGITGYTISYTGGGSNNETTVSGGDTNSYTLTGLTNGQTYTISIVATSPNQLASSPIMKQVRLVSTPAQPVVDTNTVVATADTITLSWAVPPDVTGSEVSWELTEERRRRRVRNAEEGTSGPLSADQNSYTIDKLRIGTSYDITVTVFNPAGNSSTTFTRSTEEGSPTSSPNEDSGGSGVGGIVAGVIIAIVLVVAVVAILIVVVWLVKRRSRTVSKYVPAERDSVRFSAKDSKVSSDEAPVIVEFPEDTLVQEGEGVVLKVEVTGVPHPKLTWYHNGVEVVPDYSRELAEDGTLTLPSAETKHSGVYQLVARNRGGSAEREVKLQVEQEGVEEGIAAEEPSYETVALRGPVPVAVFGSHVEQRHSKNNKPFKEEYEGLPTYADKPVTVATTPDNKLKNRFANICVYDDNRVVLNPLAKYDSDYVNASYVDGYSTKGKFIATQGPLPKTVVDFWRLVWQERAPTIVMITNLVEGTKIKCQQYWPEGGAQGFGPFQITVTDQQTLADYTLRRILVQLKGSSERPLNVSQFHFTAWPDHGVPDYATPILTFHRRVMKEHKSGPIVVHCRSAP
ncbi:Receptor-type tyrosine-protein phosphatase S, partial [Geodia barretti]